MTSTESKNVYLEYKDIYQLLQRYTENSCSPFSIKQIQERLSELKADEFKDLLSYHFDNPEVIKAAICISNSILLDNNLGMENSYRRIKNYITNIQKIGRGSFGTVYKGSIKRPDALSSIGEDIFAIKSSHWGMVTEAAIAILSLNQLRTWIPNFMIIYGIFSCSPPREIDSENVSICDESGKSSYALCELIPASGGGGLKGILNISEEGIRDKQIIAQELNRVKKDLLSFILQIVHTLEFAYDYCGFSHNDFQAGNVMARNVLQQTVNSDKKTASASENKAGFWIHYPAPLNKAERKDRWIYSPSGKIATIIDYGRSHVMFEQNNKINHIGHIPWSQLCDCYVFMFTLVRIIRNLLFAEDADEVIKYIRPIILFFTLEKRKLDNLQMVRNINNGDYDVYDDTKEELERKQNDINREMKKAMDKNMKEDIDEKIMKEMTERRLSYEDVHEVSAITGEKFFYDSNLEIRGLPPEQYMKYEDDRTISDFLNYIIKNMPDAKQLMTENQPDEKEIVKFSDTAVEILQKLGLNTSKTPQPKSFQEFYDLYPELKVPTSFLDTRDGAEFIKNIEVILEDEGKDFSRLINEIKVPPEYLSFDTAWSDEKKEEAYHYGEWPNDIKIYNMKKYLMTWIQIKTKLRIAEFAKSVLRTVSTDIEKLTVDVETQLKSLKGGLSTMKTKILSENTLGSTSRYVGRYEELKVLVNQL